MRRAPLRMLAWLGQLLVRVPREHGIDPPAWPSLGESNSSASPPARCELGTPIWLGPPRFRSYVCGVLADMLE